LVRIQLPEPISPQLFFFGTVLCHFTLSIVSKTFILAISDILLKGIIMAGKTIKLDTGTIYKKNANGSYYFRYQVNGQRKAVSLKTKNQKEAKEKALELIPLIKASTPEIISAHVQHAKGMTTKKKSIALQHSWEVYSKAPERAMPSTVREQDAFNSTFKEFIDFVGDDSLSIAEITPEITNAYAQHLRGLDIAVDTHNRKIRRLSKIFEVMKEYRNSENPFKANSLRRKEREEQEHIIRRMSFTREQEMKLLEVLENDKYKVKNKPEIRVAYHLGMFTGQRLKDCVLLRWDKVDLKRKRIWVKQFKTGKEVTIPIAPKLLEVLIEAKKWKVNYYVCPNIAKRYSKVNSSGKNIGDSLVNIDMLRVIKWIGLVPSIKVPGRKKKVTIYGFHSLRHSFASHCAEAGVPKAVVLSILGANSDVVDKHYTHIGEEAQEKAIMAISGGFTTSITDRDRIELALDYIESLKDKNEEVVKIEEILKSS
jgi:integrase